MEKDCKALFLLEGRRRAQEDGRRAAIRFKYCSLLNFSGLSPNRTQSGRKPIGRQHLSGQMDG